jgi:hypothetical protein
VRNVDFHQRNMRTLTIFWWKILNNLVRIHSAVYRWAVKVNMVGENYGFVTGAHPEVFLSAGERGRVVTLGLYILHVRF